MAWTTGSASVVGTTETSAGAAVAGRVKATAVPAAIVTDARTRTALLRFITFLLGARIASFSTTAGVWRAPGVRTAAQWFATNERS